MEINIFKNKELKINLEKFVDSRALICANSGGGKSYAVRKILEESSNKVMSIILDIEGEFRTLREKFDFLLIGNEGDVNINTKSARLLPKKIMELEVSTIIDISDLKRNERIRYVKEFLESLMELPRKNENKGTYWKPCIIVLDEAHLLAGQQEKQDSCPSVIDLMTRGRKRGYCGILCTQRISKLHKDAVAECNNILIGRTGLDIDMKRASEILGFTTKKDMLSLRDLKAGEFYTFGTAISRHVTKATIEKVQTTHPKVGIDLRKEIIKPTQNIIKILEKIKDLPQQAEKELKELNDYKKEITELKTKIRILENTTTTPDEKQIQKIKEQAYNQGIKEQQKQTQEIQKAYTILEKKLTSMARILGQETKIPEIKENTTTTPKYENITKNYENNTITTNNEEPNLNLCERKIYGLLYQYQEKTFTKPQIGVFTGYSHKSGGFNNSLSRLRQLELIEGSGNNIKIKQINHNIAQEFDFSKEAIIQKLNKCEREIYNVLLNNQEENFKKEELAQETQTQYSATSGGFNNAISRLKTLGIIQRNNGTIRINPELLEL